MPVNPITGKGNAWKGGRSGMANGYIRIWAPHHPLANKYGYALEHRLVLYEAGVEIPPGHSVHHINHDRADNRRENLAVMAKGDHHRHHVQVAGVITNQYGTFPVLKTKEERTQRSTAQKRRYLAAKGATR